MRQATLKNKLNGVEVRVHATTEHPDSSYGRAVWVDDGRQYEDITIRGAIFNGYGCEFSTPRKAYEYINRNSF